MTTEQHLTQQDGRGSQIGRHQHSLATLTHGSFPICRIIYHLSIRSSYHHLRSSYHLLISSSAHLIIIVSISAIFLSLSPHIIHRIILMSQQIFSQLQLNKVVPQCMFSVLGSSGADINMSHSSHMYIQHLIIKAVIQLVCTSLPPNVSRNYLLTQTITGSYQETDPLPRLFGKRRHRSDKKHLNQLSNGLYPYSLLSCSPGAFVKINCWLLYSILPASLGGAPETLGHHTALSLSFSPRNSTNSPISPIGIPGTLSGGNSEPCSLCPPLAAPILIVGMAATALVTHSVSGGCYKFQGNQDFHLTHFIFLLLLVSVYFSACTVIIGLTAQKHKIQQTERKRLDTTHCCFSDCPHSKISLSQICRRYDHQSQNGTCVVPPTNQPAFYLSINSSSTMNLHPLLSSTTLPKSITRISPQVTFISSAVHHLRLHSPPNPHSLAHSQCPTRPRHCHFYLCSSLHS
ncbi:hypothetical protein VP01_2441g1 [Puccinia sorghi]|uniref:Uncharacterized protein n=1 Tax=Puccinia sorghi TaxID=27349 RepID=A0A0L6V6E1_9BASI|nr:hypothetical protein VP01_2441g1 [Puccinia sorghi]